MREYIPEHKTEPQTFFSVLDLLEYRPNIFDGALINWYSVIRWQAYRTRYNKKIGAGCLVSIIIKSFARVPAWVVHTGSVYFQPTSRYKKHSNINSISQQQFSHAVYSCLYNQSINHLFTQDKIKMAITHTHNVSSKQDNKAISALTVALKNTYRYTCTFIHLSLIHIWRCRRSYACRSRWSPYH